MDDSREAGLNIASAARLIDEVRAAGTTDFCVCAGSRNSPLLAVLGGQSDVRLFSFVDERSAAFFALGRAKLHGAPVAVVTTSGTAVAELLPAAVEAYYSGLPLILITADRPARYRGTGAPQSIEQEGIFGVYAETSLESWGGRGALHLNIEFDEPLIDGEVIPSARDRGAAHVECGGVEPPLFNRDRGRNVPVSATGVKAVTRHGASVTTPREVSPPHSTCAAPRSVVPLGSHPLIIVGGLAPAHRERVRELLLRANAPVYAEPLSGLREDPSLPLITAGERMIAHAKFDTVIRIGNVPALRFWRDLDTSDLPVVHYSDLPFTGLTRGAVRPIAELSLPEGTRDEAFFARDRELAARFAAILDEEPESELAMIRAVSRELGLCSRVYLGNSLPIREWDLAASREPHGFTYEANRGANGIDGQLSTFFGWCDPAADNVCVAGDLTTIYDLGAPWIVPQLGHRRFRIVVVNNGGGRIFSRVASLRAVDTEVRSRIIENSHDVRFEHWAAMWGIDVTELRPDAEASRRVWQRYDELWA